MIVILIIFYGISFITASHISVNGEVLACNGSSPIQTMEYDLSCNGLGYNGFYRPSSYRIARNCLLIDQRYPLTHCAFIIRLGELGLSIHEKDGI